LGLLVAATASCGGTGSEKDRANQEIETSAVVDPGSQPVVCGVEDEYEFKMIADFELGSVAGGWYFNNDQCDKCQKTIDRIKEIKNAAKTIVGLQDLAPGDLEGQFGPDKNGCLVRGDVIKKWYNDELPLLDETLEKGDPSKNVPPNCKAVCEASQTPSAFIKPVAGDRIAFDGKDKPRCGSRYAMHVKGGPFQTWGGVFAVQFGSPGLDADDSEQEGGKKWEGISFWARVGPESRHPLRIELSDELTDDKQKVYQGELVSELTTEELADWCKAPKFVCNGDSVRDDTNGCDKFGANRSMTTDWKFFTIDFANLRQSGWGQKAVDENGALASLNINQIRTLNFLWTTGVWDVWIDDVALYRRLQP
jgi:hypothetical protein